MMKTPKPKRRPRPKMDHPVESFTIGQPSEGSCFWEISHRWGDLIHKRKEGPDARAKRIDGGVYESAVEAARALLALLEQSELEVK